MEDRNNNLCAVCEEELVRGSCKNPECPEFELLDYNEGVVRELDFNREYRRQDDTSPLVEEMDSIEENWYQDDLISLEDLEEYDGQTEN